LFEHVHGHLALLATLALIHPAVLLRRPRRRARLATASATVLATVTAALGLALYPTYRSLIKPAIFANSPVIGNAFERKEHLAVAVVVLAWVGLVSHWATGEATSERPWARVAHVAYVGAAAIAVLTAGLGVAVAVQRSF
jgi:hypothetical protein